MKGAKPMPNITYTLVGDYLLPNITLRDSPDAEPLTKYGLMRRPNLKNHRPILYNRLLLTKKLYPHLRDTQRAADERLDKLMAQLVERDPPPDKATDGLAWAAHINALKHSVEEIIFSELVYE
jgi:hypothetical protein